ncbi:MAG: cytochrome c oxidase assembly protein [Gemmatimonadales bacterium]
MFGPTAALPLSPWLRLIEDWRPDAGPTVAMALLLAAYGTGVRRAWRHAGAGRGIRRAQVAWFAAAVAVLVIALVSPLDTMGEQLFAAHMTQHMLLAVIVPPLLVCGAPELAFLWMLPGGPRRRLMCALRQWTPVRRSWLAITAPAIAWLIHAAAIWSWHAPRLYELALRSDVAHAAEHLSFVGTGVLLWWAIVHPRGQRRTAYAVGILTLFATAAQMGILGALLTLSHRAWYPAQSAGAAAWGFTSLEDQQLAGLIMWVPGGLLYVAAMSVLFLAWVEGPATARRRAARVLMAAGVAATGACRGSRPSVVPGGDVQRGKTAISAVGCGACHTIDGIAGAQGEVGPPLSGVARRSIIAGELANTPENMVRWIRDPQSVEPNTAMPNLDISEQSARDIAAYLYSRQ